MTPGQIVVVDWRDALPGSREPNKKRPGVVIGSPRFFGEGNPHEIVVPLAGMESMALDGASLAISPTTENGCTKTCYALAWNVQCVPHVRLRATASHVTVEQLTAIRALLAASIDA